MSEESEDIFTRPSPTKECNDLDTTAVMDEIPPRIILVCFLCFRQYDLVEDLRGHMIEYHKYRPIKENSPKPINKTDEKQSIVNTQNEEKVVKVTNDSVTDLSVTTAVIDSDLKPMPFKDFRLILRSNMGLKCPKYSNCIYKFETNDKLQQHIKCHAADKTTFQCLKCPVKLENWRRCSAHLWKTHEMDVDLL
ncbi:hypothetical protein DOY81_009902, partial [Sarcophaga bullata]